MELIRPKALVPGDTIGVFTPSSPSYRSCEELFTLGVMNLEKLGFQVKLGELTACRSAQGYRSGTPEERAKEFMDLIRNPGVHGLISTIGEWPNGVTESSESFMAADSGHRNGSRKLKPFSKWSNHKRTWENGDWKKIPREWKQNSGWRVLQVGEAEEPLLAANLSTPIASAGTEYFPDMNGKILLLESMSAAFATEETKPATASVNRRFR